MDKGRHSFKELGIFFKPGVLVQPKVSGPWQLRKKCNCEFEAGLGNTATSQKIKIKYNTNSYLILLCRNSNRFKYLWIILFTMVKILNHASYFIMNYFNFLKQHKFKSKNPYPKLLFFKCSSNDKGGWYKMFVCLWLNH